MPNFNSIKVQLKQQSILALQVPTAFQFHKGTIKTKVLMLNLLRLRYFNSIKVQLKLPSSL